MCGIVGYTGALLSAGVMFYISLFTFGLATTITEWRKIRATAWQKILYTFTFPLFQFTYVPIALVALVTKVEWRPIKHTAMSSEKLRARLDGRVNNQELTRF